jgi:hypothetical protein
MSDVMMDLDRMVKQLGRLEKLIESLSAAIKFETEKSRREELERAVYILTESADKLEEAIDNDFIIAPKGQE